MIDLIIDDEQIETRQRFRVLSKDKTTK